MSSLVPMTRSEFVHLKSRDAYFHQRWPYFEAVLEMASRLEYNSVLELGCYRRPIIEGSDTMDIEDCLDDGSVTYLWDVRKTPWPVTKRYDLFIAMQVWEHLTGEQAVAFKEVPRICRHAILTFPFKWKCATSDIHNGIDSRRISEWTLGTKPVEVVHVKKPNVNRTRAVYLFAFD